MIGPGTLRTLTVGVALIVSTGLFAASPAPRAGVAVLHGAAWQPGDVTRDGAGEFAVFLLAAQLQKAHRAAGLVAVCDRHGNLRSGGERALRRLVFSGLAVVKLTHARALNPDEQPAFLDGGRLAPETASEILTRCLERHGAPPVAADPENPTAAELAALRAHLRPFQTSLSAAAGPQLAQL